MKPLYCYNSNQILYYTDFTIASSILYLIRPTPLPSPSFPLPLNPLLSPTTLLLILPVHILPSISFYSYYSYYLLFSYPFSFNNPTSSVSIFNPLYFLYSYPFYVYIKSSLVSIFLSL